MGLQPNVYTAEGAVTQLLQCSKCVKFKKKERASSTASIAPLHKVLLQRTDGIAMFDHNAK
jgi:hypothetical protein